MKYQSNNTQFCCSHSEYVQLSCDFVNKNFDKFLLHAKMSGNLNIIIFSEKPPMCKTINYSNYKDIVVPLNLYNLPKKKKTIPTINCL